MDGIETEINAAVNALDEHEFQKMLEEAELVLDANQGIQRADQGTDCKIGP